MSYTKRWANVLCNEEMTPFKLIVTDGDRTSEIPITNTKLSNVKRWAYEIYNVPHKNILVTQIFDSKHE